MGTVLGRGVVVGDDFRILDPLQSGGMGAVYVAEQLSTGKRRALKVMHATLVDDPVQVERFVREAKLAARVQSEHVVEILAAGVDEGSATPWLAMELLEGCDLSRLVKSQGPLDRDEALAIVEQLCHGLGAAHDEGIVHRDLKPQNVFFAKLKTSARPWTVKILDFGIAKAVADSTSAATAALGSPAWMAPEQTEASSDIAPSSDIWSLGLVVFWMLTGRIYWRAANRKHAGMQAVFREMLFEPLPPGSERARAIDAPGSFPQSLDDWLGRCLDRDPSRRFDDARNAWSALCEAADYDAPASHVLPMTIASRVAEASVPATRRVAPSNERPEESAPETAATREVTPPTVRAPSPGSPESEGASLVSESAPSTVRTDPNETLDVTPGQDAALAPPTDPTPKDELGPTLESHELIARRQQAERARPRWMRVAFAAAFLVTGGLAAAVFTSRQGASPAASTGPTLPPTTPRTATVVASTARPTATATATTSLTAAEEALAAGRIDRAERLASQVLDALGSIAGRRPPNDPPSLEGAGAQRVLTGVALARAARKAPSLELADPETGLPTSDPLASSKPYLDEARTACSKARTWSDEPQARCCQADLSLHFAEAAADAKSRPTIAEELTTTAKRHLEAVNAEPPEACADLVARVESMLEEPSRLVAETPAPTAPAPFDGALAQGRIAAAAAKASRLCSGFIGDRSITLSVGFEPSGFLSVQDAPSSPAAQCAAQQMRTVRVPPFEPETTPPPRSVSITLD